MYLLQALRRAGDQGAVHEPAVNVVLLISALKMVNGKRLELGNY